MSLLRRQDRLLARWSAPFNSDNFMILPVHSSTFSGKNGSNVDRQLRVKPPPYLREIITVICLANGDIQSFVELPSAVWALLVV